MSSFAAGGLPLRTGLKKSGLWVRAGIPEAVTHRSRVSIVIAGETKCGPLPYKDRRLNGAEANDGPSAGLLFEPQNQSRA